MEQLINTFVLVTNALLNEVINDNKNEHIIILHLKNTVTEMIQIMYMYID